MRLQRYRYWIGAGVGLLVTGWLALYFWLLADLPPVQAVEARLVRPTTQIVDRNGLLLYEVIDPQTGKQINLSLESLPAACIQATLATEDSRFYQHPGVDLLAIGRALWQNVWAGGTIVSGGSTLTQQLARNLLLEPDERYEQNIRRKLREAWLAWRLELHYSKDELLALYLNQTYFGNFAFGMEAAAQNFFAKPASQLSRAECALLVGLVQYPTGYNPLQAPDVAKERQLTVLRLMREAGYLSASERTQIASEPLHYRSRLFHIQAPHFVMYVQELLARQVGVDRLRQGGLRIITTLDLDLQRQAEATIRHRLDLLNCRKPGLCDSQTDPKRRVDNAAAVILDSQSGDILAMVGNPNYFDTARQGNVNAALTLRQPGSAIKPLTYAAALDPGWNARLGLAPLTPASIIADLPTTFYVEDAQGSKAPYTPVNYDRSYHGPVSVRTALASSYNIPAVKTLERIGVKTLQEIAGQAGISTFANKFGLALTLGGGEVKLLELTTAFGIFQRGERLYPKAILSIDSRAYGAHGLGAAHYPMPATDSPLPPSSTPVISPATAYLITDILSDPVARIPAFGEGSVLELPFPAAVKTGTTTDWRDNWSIGYSTRRMVGVWVGNADNTPMLDVSGIDGAGPIWHDLMLAAHPTPPPAFPRPPEIVEALICAPSGLLPSPSCPRTRRERFIRGSEPTRIDDQFEEFAIDLATGLRADDQTPAERIAQRTYWRLPAEYHDWMVGQGISLPPPARSGECGAQAGPCPLLAAGVAFTSPLILSAPTSNIAYQLHPGLPRDHQQIEVAGFVADGLPWAELQLMQDGVALRSVSQASRLNVWWPLTVGEHRFWLQGRPYTGAAWVVSPAALVVVEEFGQGNDNTR